MIVEVDTQKELCEALGGKISSPILGGIVFSLDEIQKDKRWEEVPKEDVDNCHRNPEITVFRMKGNPFGNLRLAFSADDPTIILWFNESVLMTKQKKN
jgi:hypothetical protein